MIPKVPKSDATFLRRCLEILYKGRLQDLETRSIRGQMKLNGREMMPITPEKKRAIYEEYRQRVFKIQSTLSEEEFSDRLRESNINRKLNLAICNIRKKLTVVYPLMDVEESVEEY